MIFSVIIAAYNEEKLIAKCVKALKNQTFPKSKYEVIVVDNGSTDNTALLARMGGARVVSYKKEQRASSAKNYGGELAKGEIIAYTDADTIPNSDWLESIDKLMENKKLICVGGTTLSSENDNSSVFMLKLFHLFAKINQLFGISLIWGSNMAVRRDAFIQVGGINTELKSSDDWEFVLRIQKKFGIRSTYYSESIKVRTSPRKQENVKAAIPYFITGIVNYISIFILRRAKTYGKLATIR